MMKQIQQWGQKVTAEISRVFLGKQKILEKLLVSILLGGHVLLEDVPGLGKTILARTIAMVLGGKFSRIQGTPDLLPSDVIGVSIFNQKTNEFYFRKGPILSNVVLVDEINRATPRTQSALLEAMAEATVTVEGKTLQLPQPFFLLATENPIDFEGTFPLPEAQKDRFLMALKLGYPQFEVEKEVVLRQNRLDHPIVDIQTVSSPEEILELKNLIPDVYVDEKILDYQLQLVQKTRNHAQVSIGASPRASIALFKSSQALAALRGRTFVIPDDVKELFLDLCDKRIILSNSAMMRGQKSTDILKEIIEETEVPQGIKENER
jgi:MoxR-like ATPase